MPLHWNKIRFFKGTVGASHGILVILLRQTKIFWRAYRDLMRLNGKLQSDENDLRKVMAQLPRMKPKRKVAKEKERRKILARIYSEFDQGLTDLELMFNSLDTLEKEDETLLFRAMTEISELYNKFYTTDNLALPDHMKIEILNSLYALMAHIDQLQHHTWVVSKAHARGFTKISEISLVSSRLERRRLRRNTLELNHILNRIGPLKEWILRMKFSGNHDELKRLHHRVVELLELYHDEIEDIHHILQEAHVLTRRTEKLFNRIENEANALGDEKLKHRVHEYYEKFHQIHHEFEKMARKEALDIHILFKRASAPKIQARPAQVRAAA